MPESELVIKGFKAESGVNEQPVENETIIGAINRLVNAIRVLVEEGFAANIVISIESGIFQTPDGSWEDKAIVYLSSNDERDDMIEPSEGVVFPDKYVEEAERRGFNQHTVGSVIAEMNPDSDPTDPHAFLTKDSENPVTREGLLINTL